MRQTLTLIFGLLLFFPSYAKAEETIKIGDLSGYTGIAYYADPYREGWQFALQEINEGGGVLGRKLEVISRDTRANPSDAITVAQELIHSEQVFALMGPIMSHVGLAVSEIARREKIPFVSALAGTDKLLWEAGHSYVFRIHTGATELSNMLLTEPKTCDYKRWGIIAENYEAGHAYASAFIQGLQNKCPSAELVVEQYPALNKMEAGSVIAAVKKEHPDALIVFLVGTNMASYLQEIGKRDFDDIPVFNVSLGLENDRTRYGDFYPNGWTVLTAPKRHEAGEAYAKFYDDFEAFSGRAPNELNIVGYLALKAIATAIEKAGSIDRNAMTDQMNKPLFPFFNDDYFTFRSIDNQAYFPFARGKSSLINGIPSVIDTELLNPSQYEVSKEWILEQRGKK